MRNIVSILYILCVAGILSSFIASENLVIDLASHFFLHYIVVVFLLGIVSAFKKHNALAWICFITAMVLFPIDLIRSGSFHERMQSEPKQRIKILFSNVLAKNADHERLLNYVREINPDIAVFAETERLWDQSLSKLADMLPHENKKIRTDNFGILVRSRFPLEEQRIEEYGYSQLPSLLQVVQIPEAPLSLFATHPLPPVSASHVFDRNQMLRELFKLAPDYRAKAQLVVVGDLNTTPHTRVVRGILSDAKLALLPCDAAGFQGTWPDFIPVLRIPIDHALMEPGPWKFIQCYRGKNIGSDHYPIVLELGRI